MTPVACPRLFEAEAMRDGRLAGAALASFARHTTICRSCQREVQALEALAEALRARRPGDARVDELHGLRERTRLVAAFDNALVAPRRRSNAMRRAFWPATAAIIASAIFLWHARSGPDVEPAPTVIVHAGAAAVWSKHPEEGHDKIVLERGDLWIRVDHARRQSALIVALPDGELEDTGTTFTVSAAGGRTTRVAVEEGSVLLRIHGRPPVAIGRAESWAPALPAPASPAPGRSEAIGPPHRGRATAPAAPARRASPAAPVAPPYEADPALDFRAAVAVLDSGANREAAAAFARFVAKHARDARAEDAAYLRVIALQRCGADDEMRRAAQDYLRLYPAGFRHAEMENLTP